ncbi:Quinone oxidoreductase PIG3, partial [Linum perenne]
IAGVDVILDCLGASYFQRNLDSLNFDGRLFIIGMMGGAKTEMNIPSLFAKRLTVYKVFPFSEAADAHRLIESSQHIGKILLVP